MPRHPALPTAAVVALALAGCAGSGPRGVDPKHAEGARLYRTYCGLCHGDELEGYAADDANALRNQSFLRTVADDFLRTAIAEGHPGTAMAAYARSFGGPLEATEIDAIVAYIRSFQRDASLPVHDDTVTGQAEEARQLYAARCAGCHGRSGQGDTAISLNSPVFLDTASDGQIRYAIAKGREDTPMPAFENDLPPDRIDDLVAFVRSLRVAGPPRQRVAQPEIDYDDVVIHPQGPAPTFHLREERFVPAAEVAEALEQGARLIVLDARPTSEWLDFHIPGAIPTPYYAVDETIEHLPRDGTFIVAYCGCPHAASGQVVDALRRAGFENTAVLDEGIFYWRDEGYPVASGEDE